MTSAVPNPFARAGFLLSCADLQQLPRDEQPEIAFAGRSNAGKSSALNAICSHKQLARVSKTPGRTQLINLFGVPGGRFADLPGYGYAEVPEQVRRDWGKLIGSYLEDRQNLVGVVLIIRGIVDVSRHDDPTQTLMGAGLAVIGLVVFFINRWQARRGH